MEPSPCCIRHGCISVRTRTIFPVNIPNGYLQVSHREKQFLTLAKCNSISRVCFAVVNGFPDDLVSILSYRRNPDSDQRIIVTHVWPDVDGQISDRFVGYKTVASQILGFDSSHVRNPQPAFVAAGRTAPGREGVLEIHPGLASASNVAARRCPDRCGGESRHRRVSILRCLADSMLRSRTMRLAICCFLFSSSAMRSFRFRPMRGSVPWANSS